MVVHGLRPAVRNEDRHAESGNEIGPGRAEEKDGHEEKGGGEKKVIGVVASGPSLTGDDCDALRRICDEVIAINDAYRLARDADHLYGCDFKWWRHHIADVTRDFDGRLWTGDYGPQANGAGTNWFEKDTRPEHWGITCLTIDVDATGLSLDPARLHGGRNSGFQAIGLAHHLGATTTILIGYDWGHTGGRAHFFGDHPAGLNRGDGSQFEGWAAFMRTIDQKRHRILNASRVTALDVFPRVALDELTQDALT